MTYNTCCGRTNNPRDSTSDTSDGAGLALRNLLVVRFSPVKIVSHCLTLFAQAYG